jgi:hypothetical protein
VILDRQQKSAKDNEKSVINLLKKGHMTMDIAKRPPFPPPSHTVKILQFQRLYTVYSNGYAIALSSPYLLFVGESIFYLKEMSYNNNEKVEKSRRDVKQISSHTQCPLSHTLWPLDPFLLSHPKTKTKTGSRALAHVVYPRNGNRVF